MKGILVKTKLMSIMVAVLMPVLSFSQGNIPKKTIECKLGKEVKVELTSTPSAGYSWSIGSPYDTALIVLKDKIFIPGKDTTLPGKPGTDVFTFKAVGQGKAVVRLVLKKEYARKVDRVEDYEFVINK